MRDLLRLLYRSGNTFLFLLLLGLALSWLVNGNAHHRGRFLTSSNAMAGELFTMRNELTEFAQLKGTNEQLAKENAEWRGLHKTAYTPVESKYVRINDTIYEQQYRYLDTKVINSTTHKQRNHLTLNKGSDSGIRADMGVIGQDGIVGKVRNVSEHFCTVISVLNVEMLTSVKLENSGHFGLLQWNTGDPTTAHVQDIAKHVKVAVGDRIVTRGSSSIFPAGIPVGTVIEVNDDPGSNYLDIVIMFAEDMTRNHHAYVVMDLMRTEKEQLEAEIPEE